MNLQQTTQGMVTTECTKPPHTMVDHRLRLKSMRRESSLRNFKASGSWRVNGWFRPVHRTMRQCVRSQPGGAPPEIFLSS